MQNLYLVIRNDVIAAWNTAWQRPDVPALWRSNEPLPDPDPTGRNGNSGVQHFFRNEVDFGREEVVAFGGGPGSNLRIQYGSVILRSFTSASEQDEDEGLRLMSSAMAIYRSYRITDAAGGDLSFIGTGSGFDMGPSEDGIWFMRGSLAVFEYRFTG